MSFLGGHSSVRHLSVNEAMNVLRRSGMVRGDQITDRVIARGIEQSIADDEPVDADWLREELELSDVGSRDHAYLTSVFGRYDRR